MRVLFSTGSAPGYMLPPVLGDEQIVCGPDWTDERAADGRIESFRTPVGEYDLADLAAKLPSEQMPDVVVCLVDASWRNLPRNLASFRCPKVLLIADTHHLTTPLMGMIRYMAAEPYDRAILLYDRHHASFFHAAGFRNLYWFPGLTFPHADPLVRAARSSSPREPRIAFVGQSGSFHPHRSRLLAKLSENGLPISQKRLAQSASLGFYGSSLIGFNSSLNGDLNLRVFEILASGAALLTDKLSPASGLERLLTEGRHMLTYGSPEELVEVAAQALNDPARARLIGSEGAKWFDNHFNQAWRLAAFRSLALDGKAVPEFEFSAEEKTRVYFGGDTDTLLQAVMVYEGVQELHREETVVNVAVEQGVSADVQAILTTLPRVALNGFDRQRATADDFEVLSSDSSRRPSAASVWYWNAAADDRIRLAGTLLHAGYRPASQDLALFLQTSNTAADLMAVAQAAMSLGSYSHAFEHARAALEADPACLEALLMVAELTWKAGQPELSRDAYNSAAALAPRDPRVTKLAESLGITESAPATTVAGPHVLLYSDDPDSGGVAQYNHAVACALIREGYRVTCIQSQTKNPLIDEQGGLGVRHRWIEYHTGRDFARTLVDDSDAVRALTADRPDLVIFSNCCPFSSLAAREATRRLGVPYIVIEGFVGEYLARNFAAHLPLLAQQYAVARAVVAVSQQNLELLHRQFGLSEGAGQVIHYGRPAHFFESRRPEHRARLRAEIGVSEDAVVCFTAARLARVKRHDLQLEALLRLRSERPDLDLHIVWAGDGDMRDALVREIARHDLGAKVHLLGHRWDTADWYDAADFFVLTSETEGMPLAIMEAMAKGLPVAATSVSGIPEELGDTGLLLGNPSADALGVVERLKNLFLAWGTDAQLRSNLGDACRRRAVAMFREADMLERTLQVVRGALASSGSGSDPAAAAPVADLPEVRPSAESIPSGNSFGVAIVMTDTPDHPFYSSWLKQAPFPVEYVSHPDSQYDFPEYASLVVTHDCYREPQIGLLRKAASRNIPCLILPDGTLEYRNTWEKPQNPPGAIFLPVLGHKIACFGRSQARVLEAWGNGGRCEVVGAPRYDGYGSLPRRQRRPDEPFRVLISTGMVPYYTDAQHALVRQSLLDLKNYFAAQPEVAGVKLEASWRLTGALGKEIGIDSVVTRQSGPKLTDELQAVDAVISWPSTVLIDAMLFGLPAATLDYCNLPHYVQTAWRITAREQIEPTVREFLHPPPPKTLFQHTTLHDSLECMTPAAPRMIRLAQRMMELGWQARRDKKPLVLPERILPITGDSLAPAEPSSALHVLYPDESRFRKGEEAATQVELGHLRSRCSELETKLFLGGGSVALGESSGRAEDLWRLLPRLSEAVLLTGSLDQTGVWEVELSGQVSRALHVHPNAKLQFTLPTGAPGRFVTAVALHPNVWNNPESGECEFRLRVDGRISLAAVIDPISQPRDRCWTEFAVEVPANSAGKHVMELETLAPGSTRHRHALFREPYFISQVCEGDGKDVSNSGE